MTVRKVQFESMDEVNRFLDVTEHFPFAVGSEKGGSRTVNGKSILGVASIGLAERWTFVHMCRSLRRRSHPVLVLHEVGLRGEK